MRFLKFAALATRHACDNGLTVCRSKVERIFFRRLTERLLEPDVVHHALRRVADEVAKLSGDVADMVARKTSELTAARKRLANLVDFVAHGRVSDSVAVSAAIQEAEGRVSRLQADLDALRREDDAGFELPSEEWVAERVSSFRQRSGWRNG